MSSDPISEDEQPKVDDEAVPEVVRKPTRTAGDISEAAGVSAGITLEEILRRVRRIEEHLGISDPEKSEPFGRGAEPSGKVHIPRSARPSLIKSGPEPDIHEESSKPEG